MVHSSALRQLFSLCSCTCPIFPGILLNNIEYAFGAFKSLELFILCNCISSMPNITGPGCQTLEINGGSSASYLARTPCIPLFVLCLLGVETEGFLDYQARTGIISIVRWNLRPVIFGVEFWIQESAKGAGGKGARVINCHNFFFTPDRETRRIDHTTTEGTAERKCDNLRPRPPLRRPPFGPSDGCFQNYLLTNYWEDGNSPEGQRHTN